MQRQKEKPSHFDSFTKGELHTLCDRLLTDDPAAIDTCIAFIECDSLGLWHNRARAMMARRLKHCALSRAQRTRLARAILDRLVSGRFSEQFKDQLRLVLHLDSKQAFAVARSCDVVPAAHVRRYASWVLSHDSSNAESEK
jgi:hypothetical protein